MARHNALPHAAAKRRVSGDLKTRLRSAQAEEVGRDEAYMERDRVSRPVLCGGVVRNNSGDLWGADSTAAD